MKLVPYKGRMVAEGWPQKIREAQEETHYCIDDNDYRRVPYGREIEFRGVDIRQYCYDCGVETGQYHVPGCDVEVCPKCGYQSISCSCDDDDDDDSSFSFKRHREKAIAEYAPKRLLYDRFANCIRSIVTQALQASTIKYSSVEARAKEIDSFGVKAATPSEGDRSKPKYADPLRDIADLAGVRVIVFVPQSVIAVDEVISKEFEVVERSDKSVSLREDERFGYASVHYLIRLSPARRSLIEYAVFSDLIAEVQVRTVLQHSWAAMSHDIEYKSSIVIPSTILRRFRALAAVLEGADREFGEIQAADQRLREEAQELIREAKLDHVEITPDAVRRYLFQKLGSDKRVKWDTFDYLARLLRTLGFRTLAEVDRCIEGYDCDAIGRLIYGARLNPRWRLEAGLFAAMGEVFVERSAPAGDIELRASMIRVLKSLEDNQIRPRPREQLPTLHN
jgi:ppGpp synthetase/RelA/SpoT-type nucleotidyltranferase